MGGWGPTVTSPGLRGRGSDRKQHRLRGGFTLIEILVACSVLAVILVLMLSMVSQAGNLWRSSNSRIEAFQGARLAFENLTRLLSQATLNTYWDYDDPNNPQRYIRKSELHFLTDRAASIVAGDTYGQAVFFQAPANYNPASSGGMVNRGDTGLTGQLNACGFYIEFASDKTKGWIPDHVQAPESRRFRLMQWVQDTKKLDIYDPQVSENSAQWISSRVLDEALPTADNIVALLIWPKEPEKQTTRVLPDQYRYDSRENSRQSQQPPNAHQLPPLLEVAMVAIDEASVVKLGDRLESTIQSCTDQLYEGGPSRFASNLKTVEANLNNARINYRVFVATIPLREAKWSVE